MSSSRYSYNTISFEKIRNKIYQKKNMLISTVFLCISFYLYCIMEYQLLFYKVYKILLINLILIHYSLGKLGFLRINVRLLKFKIN